MSDTAIDATWLNAFIQTFERCAIQSVETVIVLTEQQSRPVLVNLAELALAQLGCRFHRLVVPAAIAENGPLVRSSGASGALQGHDLVVNALCQCDVIIDLTIEGLMHAPQTPQILKSGSRIMNISNEHPEILSRMLPDEKLKSNVKDSVKHIRSAKRMCVTSEIGTDLTINLVNANTVGVWGWTDRPGTLAHWPGGLVVSFPQENAVNGILVLGAGDLNLTFKRYLESPVTLAIENDYIVDLQGNGADAALMRQYLKDFNDKAAYATSHVGWGLNRSARYEALNMYDKINTNGTELRAVAGNFLYSTGANEFADRFTQGHFDLPVMGCTISLDDTTVVKDGVLA